jgi:hypothetical protein
LSSGGVRAEVSTGVAARATGLRLTFGALWAYLAVALPVLGAVIAPMSTVDLAYNVRAGQLILETRRFLETDPFTFSAAGQSWIDQQWGAQVLLALGFGALSWAGLAVIRALLVGLVFWLVYRSCRSAGTDQRTAAWLTLVAFGVSLVALGLRPQLVGMVLFAAVGLLVVERARMPRRLWLVPLLVAVWANVHGSFIFGPALVGVAFLQDAVDRRPEARRTGIVLGASMISSCLTPLGPGVWAYVASLSTNPAVRELITEWQPTSPLTVPGAVFCLSAIAVAAGILFLRRRMLDASLGGSLIALAWLAILFVLAAYTQRAVAWWALGAPVVMAGLLGPFAERRREARSAANGAIAVTLAILVAVLLPIWRPTDPLTGPAGLLTDAPAGITRTLVATVGPDTRVFNPQRWGSWLEFAVPRAKVFVDSRVEALSSAIWADEGAVSRGDPSWPAILDRWGVTVVVASNREQAALLPRIRSDDRWREAYRDNDGAIFIRR